MTLWLLDTNIVSDLQKHPHGKVAKRVRDVGVANLCTSIIVAAELRFGAAKRASRRLSQKIDDLLDEIDVLPFESPADAHYAQIRVELERKGRLIGANDMFIAAHALAVDAVLVTANAGEFWRVPGLRTENWLA